MPVSLNVNKLWQRIAGKTKTNPVDVVAQRFLQAFFDHGVEAAQIPRLLPLVKLDDLKSEEALLAVLTPDVLDQTAQLFGIRSQWLEGVDDEIYECRDCYKQPELFFEHFATLHPGSEDLLAFPVRALSTAKNLDCTDSGEQLLALVLVEQVARLGDEPVYRYHVYRDVWDWSYAPARIQLKAMVRTVCKPITQVNTKAWYKALKRAGIEDFRWHDLRHTWASWLTQQGVPLNVIQEMGAWESAEMVRRYAHLAPEQFAQHARVVDDLLNGTILAQSK